MDLALDYLANLINAKESQAEGYSMAVRWLCLREELREQYRAQAEKQVNDWWKDELAARSLRRNDP